MVADIGKRSDEVAVRFQPGAELFEDRFRVPHVFKDISTDDAIKTLFRELNLVGCKITLNDFVEPLLCSLCCDGITFDANDFTALPLLESFSQSSPTTTNIEDSARRDRNQLLDIGTIKLEVKLFLIGE